MCASRHCAHPNPRFAPADAVGLWRGSPRCLPITNHVVQAGRHSGIRSTIPQTMEVERTDLRGHEVDEDADARRQVLPAQIADEVTTVVRRVTGQATHERAAVQMTASVVAITPAWLVAKLDASTSRWPASGVTMRVSPCSAFPAAPAWCTDRRVRHCEGVPPRHASQRRGDGPGRRPSA